MLEKQLYQGAWQAYRAGDLANAWSRCQTLVRNAPGAAQVWDITSRVAQDLRGSDSREPIFCGLEWEPDCLAFHRSPAPSMTASLAQVRNPFYTSSIGKWQNYQEELAPLATKLRQAGIAI